MYFHPAWESISKWKMLFYDNKNHLHRYNDLSTNENDSSTPKISLRPFASLREKTEHNVVCAHANYNFVSL